jgi:hypothetical protein
VTGVLLFLLGLFLGWIAHMIREEYLFRKEQNHVAETEFHPDETRYHDE